MKHSFSSGALKFLKDLSAATGDDLIYSLALEKGNVFVCVAAHPSMTKKRFDTEKERLLFLIDENEYGKLQSDVVSDIASQIEDHIYYVKKDDEN